MSDLRYRTDEADVTDSGPTLDARLADTKGYRVEIDHRTSYQFDTELEHGVQRLRLRPSSGPTQVVVKWDLTIENGEIQAEYVDHLGNAITLIGIDENASSVSVQACGVVDTHQHIGIIGKETVGVPLFYYTQSTDYTAVGPALTRLVKPVANTADRLSQMHLLSETIANAVDYQVGSTSVATTAEEAANLGGGVCQDHAHIFVGLARWLGVPARYVSGYLVVDEESGHPASHAWADAWIEDLGWVGFDISNRVSADGRYVRLAVGRDYREAAPISGITYGTGNEHLDVSLDVYGHEQ